MADGSVELGDAKIDWAWAHMPVLAAAAGRLDLHGLRVAMCIHLEAKTACLALALQQAGAQVAITGSNPLSTQDDVCRALAARGPQVHARHAPSEDEYRGYLRRVLDSRPDVILDDGGDLVTLLHSERPEQTAEVRGATEETTTGLHRFRAMAADGVLRFPVVAVNDARMKYLFDNRHGTGQSVWEAVMHATNLLIAGRDVCVVGYGWCGKGVARRAQGLGARVTVCEIDPVAANEALLDGCRVLPAMEAAAACSVFVTCTGNHGVLGAAHFERMPDGALLCNAGHFNVEVRVDELAAMAVERRAIRPGVEAFKLAGGRTLNLLAEGRLVNLAAGDGHPVEIMDTSFALQALALDYMAREGRSLPRSVLPVPAELDLEVARLRLAAAGAAIDELSGEQEQYLSSWRM